MKIRKANKKDIQQMLKIIQINSPKYPIKEAKKEILEMFFESLHKPTYLVIEDNKEMVAFGGFIHSWIDNAIINLFWINVHPAFKEKGIGKKLVKEMIKEIKNLKQKPKPKLILISTKMPEFYKKFGFKIITAKYDRDYILMGKKLR